MLTGQAFMHYLISIKLTKSMSTLSPRLSPLTELISHPLHFILSSFNMIPVVNIPLAVHYAVIVR